MAAFWIREAVIRLDEGRRLFSNRAITGAKEAAELLADQMKDCDREVVLVVNLNARNQPINFNIVSIGTLRYSLVDVSNVLKCGILSNAASFLIAHNHPSGSPLPSEEDMEITKRLILAGSLMGIACIDHVIVAGVTGEIYSLREHMDLDFSPGYETMMEEMKDMVAANGMIYDSPFGPVDTQEVLDAANGAREEKREPEMVSIQLGRGFCQFFVSKKGDEMARIKIPNTGYESWPTFVVPARLVHENRYGKGYWMKLPAEGRTTLGISLRITGPDGTVSYQNKRVVVSNRELKNMVEYYKKDRGAQSEKDQGETKETEDKGDKQFEPEKEMEKEPEKKPKRKGR